MMQLVCNPRIQTEKFDRPVHSVSCYDNDYKTKCVIEENLNKHLLALPQKESTLNVQKYWDTQNK